MLTPEQLTDLREKIRSATPGPWEVHSDFRLRCLEIEALFGARKVVESDTNIRSGVIRKEDATYIAAANPATILQLLDMIERLEKEADWLSSQLSDNIDHAGVQAWREAARMAVE